MAVVTPSAFAVVTKGQLFAPAMAAQPLQQALENVNYLWRYHQPPLLSVIYTVGAALTRATEYHIPVIPSQETGGLRYAFQHRFVCSDGAATVQVTVESCTTYAGGATVWTSVYTQGVASAGAGALTTHTSAATVIPTAAVAIRVTYGAPSAGTRTDHHLLVYPAPFAPSTGSYSTGYKPFDNGILGATGAPIHEELLQRCAISSRAVLTDRKHCAFAFVQEYSTTPHLAVTTAKGGIAGHTLPAPRGYLPGAVGEQSFAVRVIATVNGGSNAGLIAVQGELFDADGTLQSATITRQAQDPGAQAYCDWAVTVKNTSGQETRLFAVVAFWAPSPPTDNVVAWSAKSWPVALVSTLAKAIARVESAALTPYAGTAHCFDGQSATALLTRYFGAMITPGLLRLRPAVTQTASASSALTPPAYTTVTAASAVGADCQLPWNHAPGINGVSGGGAFGTLDSKTTLSIAAPIDILASGDGTLALTLANLPAVEPMSISDATGVGLMPWRLLENMENLP